MSNESDTSPKRSTGSGPRPLPKSGQAPRRYGTGDVIAQKYRLAKRLGEGGMGEVWRAHNETLDIDVAIKLIRGDVARTTEQADRLLNEARAAARLGHPAIVRINDFGKTDAGDPFIVMELLQGEDLADALARRGRLSATKAIRTILPIAHALSVAHTKGIVHRDLKPENIYLAQNEEGQIQPKLVDFGVAKLEAQRSIRITQTGALLGSPLYMSPEQARGDDVDHRADVWALGVVLYEMITGRPPFEGKNYNAVLYSIIANPPAPIKDLGAGDEDLWLLLDRALQKDPDRRYYSMRDFGGALATWLQERGVQEDISGASLQTTWLHFRRDEGDRLVSMPPGTTSSEALSVELPPPPSAIPTRARTTTVRRRRSGRYFAKYLALAIGITGLVIAIAAFLSQGERVVEPDPQSETVAARHESTPVLAPPPTPLPPPPAATHAEADVEPQVAVDPSALPVAKDDQQQVAPKRRQSRPRRSSTTRDGITVRDPYATSTKTTLKNPF